MLARRFRGAFGSLAMALGVVLSACSNGTEPTQVTCDSSNPLTLSLGEVRTPLVSTCVFIDGGATGGEFALVPFNTDTVFGRSASLTFTGSGVSTVATPLQSIVAAASPTYDRQTSLSATGAALELGRPDFERQLRMSERRVLRGLFPGARAWYRNRFQAAAPHGGVQPSFSASTAAWALNDTVPLNANTGTTLAAACSTSTIRGGRVVAISKTAIVVADTGNPTGGYTDVEYQVIAQQFDTVYTMDTTAFGAPSDLDGNGKVILFFTRAVNELNPPNSGSSVISGFFFARDLFPRTDSPDLGAGSGCPTSNVAEMFYLMVPDPNGVVNGNKESKEFVQHVSVSVTAHEFQHLINAARRLYVNTTATDFETVWLNEGLSHVAEELLFYTQSAGLAPRMDIDSIRISSSTKNIDAYNFDQAQNFGRYRSYLQKPSANSPYAPNDSLETRGATWSFLRYAADHRGTSDGDTWRKLVNSTTEGIGNLQNVFGTDLSSIFRDWATSNITDDVPNVAPQWQEPSWNFRSLYVRIYKAFPLAWQTLGEGTPLSVTLKGGGSAYARFTIAAGQVGTVSWGTLPSKVALSIVRLK